MFNIHTGNGSIMGHLLGDGSAVAVSVHDGFDIRQVQLTGTQLDALIDGLEDLKHKRRRAMESRALTASAQELVAAGMAWLDANYPDHVERFDPERFHISCHGGRDCALIQATGEAGWSGAVLAVFNKITYGDFEILAFTIPYDDRLDSAARYDSRDARTEEINQAWLDAYAARRAE